MFDAQWQNPMGGYNYGGYQPQQMPKIMNNLTEEEIKLLQQNRSKFNLGLTEKESLQARCNHRSPDGTRDTLVFDPETGIARCTICGYEFRPVEPDASYDTIKDSADRLVDILQTIKIMYTDLPREAANEYFNIIPLIEKVPELFKFAAKSFAKHEFSAWNYSQYNMNGVQMFQNLNNLFGQGFAQPQQPQFNGAYGFGQPAPQAPFPMNPPQAPVPGANAFGYPGASAAAPYAPQTAGYQYQPPVAPAPVAPTVQTPAAPEAADTTVTQTVTV